MKYWNEAVCGAAGAIGGAIAAAFGGWTHDLSWLVAFMAIDYITGLLVAFLGKSPKTEGGGLSSAVGWLGLVRKLATLLLVLVAHGLDVMIGVNYVKTAAVIAFMVNEVLSILENASLLGVPMPEIFQKALEVLKGKGEEQP
ncbi:MAG: phage holin family protein [Candidatus Merdivicinus sp.]